jgi:serine protease inhibitor
MCSRFSFSSPPAAVNAYPIDETKHPFENAENAGEESTFSGDIDGSGQVDLIDKAFVAVDETGTEAAAATAVVMTDTSVPKPVTISADRPFIFLIRDNITRTILFTGRVLDPTNRKF